jgi:hypothetical protein
MALVVCLIYATKAKLIIRHLYGETVSWSLAIASTAQLAIGRGSTPLGDTFFFFFLPLGFVRDFRSGGGAVSLEYSMLYLETDRHRFKVLYCWTL